MRTASVSDLRRNVSIILPWLEAGEEVALTLRGQMIATIIPYRRERRIRHLLPDITGRLRKVFGRRVLSDTTINALMDQDRGRF